jgi:hypothetical protein
MGEVSAAFEGFLGPCAAKNEPGGSIQGQALVRCLPSLMFKLASTVPSDGKLVLSEYSITSNLKSQASMHGG